MSFWAELKGTVSGADGKLSHRRLSVIYFILLLTYMVIKTASGSVFPEIAWIVISGGAGLFSGLSIWQEMVNKKRNENYGYPPEQNYYNDQPNMNYQQPPNQRDVY